MPSRLERYFPPGTRRCRLPLRQIALRDIALMSVIENPTSLSGLRSWLFTPATRPDRFANSVKCGADVLVVDLEDAVPQAEKNAARANAQSLLNGLGSAALPLIAVRINAGSTRSGLDDLLMLCDAVHLPHFIVLPKVESAELVVQVDALLRERGKPPALIAMIESACALRAAASIARATDCVAGLMFGAADYAAEMGLEPDACALQLARCQLAAACSGTHVLAIDAPCFALRDPHRLRAELVFARSNGFGAKAAIHPAHVQAINSQFTPSPERVAWARQVLEVSERGAGTVDGRMVDEAIARQARRVIAAAVSAHTSAESAAAAANASADPTSRSRS